MIMDHIFLLIVSEIVVQFDSLGEKIEKIINDAGNKSFNDTKKCLHKCFVQHNVLITLVDDLNGIYGLPFLAQILSASIVIGFVGFVITVHVQILVSK